MFIKVQLGEVHSGKNVLGDEGMENRAFSKMLPSVDCVNEYGLLKKVITVSPRHMQIKEVINETQSHFLRDNIDIEKALKQHTNFLETLKDAGADVIKLDEKQPLNEQVFTRDIGFTIGNKFFVASMKEEIRKEELDVLVDWLKANEISYYQFNIPSIEGGDVIIDHSHVWVGNSHRTSTEAIASLQEQLPEYNVTSITLRDDILHLDCIFNIVDENTALIYSPAMDENSYQTLKNKYTLIELTQEEQFQLGPNVLSIGNRKIISLPENNRINNKLRQAGFKVIEVPFSEIIKSGGSFRCCTLPLLRM